MSWPCHVMPIVNILTEEVGLHTHFKDLTGEVSQINNMATYNDGCTGVECLPLVLFVNTS